MGVNVNGEPLEFTAVLNMGQFTSNLNQLRNQIQGLTSVSNQQASSMDSLVRKTTGALAAYATFAAGTQFIADIASVRGEFQQLEVAFNTMLGSKEKADKLMAQAVALAAHTPFTLQEVGTGAKQLLAYGFAADDITDNLTKLGNIAAGVSQPLGDIVYLYGTLKTQGRAYTRDIMQFTSRGIPIIGELAKQFKTSEENVQKMVESGKVGFPEIETAFNNLTGAGGIFFNLMQEQSKTLTGLTSNLQDAWARMLNEIGKSNQGLFADAIKGATVLVDNYQEVLKVIETLVAAYGSYRAAIIITNAVTAISTSLTAGYTFAETLRYQAMLLSERAMKLLNAAMLSNPATAVVAGVLALASALYFLRAESIKAQTSSQLLAGATKRIGDGMAEQEGKIRVFAETLKVGNISEQQRADIYKKLNEISPKLVENMNAQTLSYQGLTNNLKGYLTELRKRLTLEANTDAVTASIKQENAIRDKIDEAQKRVDAFKKLSESTNDAVQVNMAGVPTLTQSAKINLSQQVTYLDDLNKELKKQQKTTEEISKKGIIESQKPTGPTTEPTGKGNKQIIAETKSLEVLRALRKNIFEDYEKTTDEHHKKLLAADLKAADARIKALDVYGAAKEGAKQLQKEEGQVNTLLEARKNILEDLASLQRDSKQSGLLKEASEVDKVNEKYDEAIKKIEDYNEKVIELKKQDPKAKISIITGVDVENLNKARLQEIANVGFKLDAAQYKKSLEDKQSQFEQFEDAKKEIGIKKASEMYSAQTEGFESYISFLQSEADKITPKVFDGTANIGDQQKLIEITKAIADAREDESKRQFDKQIADYKDLLDASQSFTVQRGEVERKFNALYATLALQRGKMSESEFAERLKGLKASKQEELDIIARNELAKSDVFNKFQDGFKDVGIKATKSVLDGLKKLREEMKANAEVVKILDKAIKETEATLSTQTVEAFQVVAGTIKELFGDISINISGNYKVELAKIADTISNIGTLFDKNASNSAKTTSWIGLIVAGAKELDKYRHRKDVSAFQPEIDAVDKLKRELEFANSSMDRFMLQFDKLAGVQKIEAGITYFDEITRQADAALAALQKFELRAIVSNQLVKGKGFFVADKLVPVFQSIDTQALKSLEDYQKLFDEIKRNGNQIKTIFHGPEGLDHEVLAPVAEEDIKKLQSLIENYQAFAEAQEAFKKQLDETFTGTTASSITDSIVDGFKNGLRSAQDFAKNFEDLMKNAMLQSLKMQALEGPLKEFFKQFAAATESDNILTDDEITKLRSNFTGIIDAAGKKFDELQKITQLDFNAARKDSNSMSGAISVIRAEQADLLAGQLGAMRITAADHLVIATQQLNVLNAIQTNTSFIQLMYQLWQRVEMSGIKMRA